MTDNLAEISIKTNILLSIPNMSDLRCSFHNITDITILVITQDKLHPML